MPVFRMTKCGQVIGDLFMHERPHGHRAREEVLDRVMPHVTEYPRQMLAVDVSLQGGWIIRRKYRIQPFILLEMINK